MPLSPGANFGLYEIRSFLGAGGMGEVYLAYDARLRRQVAIKLLPAELTQDAERLARFEREAYSASSLNHPNILTIYEIGQIDSRPFIASEYVEGESLRQHMQKRRDLREMLDVAIQVASALSAAHQAGIVHRDIKPENIMLRADGYAKVLDFGLAKQANEPAPRASAVSEATQMMSATAPGMVVGTAHYMSPEQARGLPVDGRTDLWSLGVVQYEMACGRLPFEGHTVSDVIATILHREAPSILLYGPDMPAELERIIEKTLAKDREQRYQSAKDLALDLKRLRQRLDLEAELARSGSQERGAGTTSSTSMKTSGFGNPVVTERSEDSASKAVSSAEYLVSGLTRHKLMTGLAVTLLIMIAAGGYYYLTSQGKPLAASIAVLPFVNASGNPNLDYISDGLSQTLIDQISQLPQLKVIARSSSFRYRGKDLDPQEIGKALGVQNLVMGTVTQHGDSLTVHAELVDARAKNQLWGEQYSRKLSEIQAVQEEIARAILDNLRLRLTGQQEHQLASRPTASSEAYQLYLSGEFYRRTGRSEDYRKALGFYNRSAQLDPNFALAWVGVASCYTQLSANSSLDPKEALSQANAAATKALRLNDGLAEAHLQLAAVKRYAWDWTGAEREYRRAIELNPNLASAHSAYGNYLGVMKRTTEALAEIKRAEDLDPLSVTLKSSEGTILFFARRYDEAIAQFQNVLQFRPDYHIVYAYLGYTYAAKGMYEEAISQYKKSVGINGESTEDQCYRGYALAKSGRRAEALEILNKLKATKQYVSPVELAVFYAGLGDKESALASLEKAYKAHDLQMQYLKVAPKLDDLRTDPRFQSLVLKVGLP